VTDQARESSICTLASSQAKCSFHHAGKHGQLCLCLTLGCHHAANQYTTSFCFPFFPPPNRHARAAGFRERALEAAQAYTTAAGRYRAAAAAASSPHHHPSAHPGGGPAHHHHHGLGPDPRQGLKRKLKVVLSDLALVCAGEGHADDKVYDLTGL